MNIPHKYAEDIGSMKIKRGTVGGQVKMYSFDAVPICLEEECPAYGICHYHQSEGHKNAKCKVHLDYMKAITDVMFRNYSECLTEGKFFRVGTQLMSLYGTLCRIQIEKVGTSSITMLNSRGTLSAHPIFKEERETIKVIESLWRSIGLKPNHEVPEPDFGTSEEERE